MKDRNCEDIRTAIYGGTFDPLHLGHIQVAEAVIDEDAADELVFMPNYVSPFKQTSRHAPAEDRFFMIKDAVRDIEHVFVSDFELKREEPSYTIDTLNVMQDEIGGHISFVVGSDSLLTLETWWRGDDILRNFDIIEVPRGDVDRDEVEKKKIEYGASYGADITTLKAHPMEISSSEVRKTVRDDGDISRWVAPEVESYIKKHGLYRE